MPTFLPIIEFLDCSYFNFYFYLYLRYFLIKCHVTVHIAFRMAGKDSVLLKSLKIEKSCSWMVISVNFFPLLFFSPPFQYNLQCLFLLTLKEQLWYLHSIVQESPVSFYAEKPCRLLSWTSRAPYACAPTPPLQSYPLFLSCSLPWPLSVLRVGMLFIFTHLCLYN